MTQMIQDRTLGFNLFRKSKIIKAVNPFGNVSIRLLLYNDKYYWVSMMDFTHNSHDTYYVGKNLIEATECWKNECDMW